MIKKELEPSGASADNIGEYVPRNGFAGFNFRLGDQVMPYRLLIPEKTDTAKRYPLILVMHGMGSIGNDNEKQLFLASMLAAEPLVRQKHAFILSPQCPENDRWVKVASWNQDPHIYEPESTSALKSALAILDHVMKSYPIDPARIYVGGASMGGFATWELLSRRPGFFAAAFPMCGGGCIDQSALIARTPIWAFHGTDDRTVLPWNSRTMVEAVRKVGGQVKYTEYLGVEHDSWNHALKESDLYQWIFNHRR
jgi:predicted peptidase